MFRARKQVYVSSTPSSTDQDCDIRKNLKHEKAHNLLVSSPIHDPFVVLFKGRHKLSLEGLFRDRNHYMCE